MIPSIIFPILVLTLISVMQGCQDLPAANQSQTKLIITGSSTIAPLVASVGKRFESRYPDVRIDVQTGGSSRGIRDIRQGLADIGMASRSLRWEEQDLHETIIACDGIGIIVHQSNPVASLDPSSIVDIYTGNITNWREVGGNDAPITVINKAEGRATLDLFLEYFQTRQYSNKSPGRYRRQ